VTPREYVDTFRRRWRSVVAGLLLGLAIAALVASLGPREYSASVTIFVSATSADVTAALEGNELSTQRMTTYAELLTSDKIAAEVAAALGTELSAEDIAERVSASAVPETVLLTATAVDSSPQRAAQIANLVAARFIENVARLEQPTAVAPPPAPVEPGVAVAPPVVPQPLVAARIFEEASPPTSPTSPGPTVTLIVGAFLGLVGGLGLALLRNALDNSVSSPAQLRDVLGAPVLGTLAAGRRDAPDTLVMRADPQSAAAEGFRQLRTNLQYVALDHRCKVLLITSPKPHEQQTALVCNLAVAMADAGARVLVIGADLRRPSSTVALAVDRRTGLTDVLAGTTQLAEVIQHWTGRVDILPSGAIPPNPSDLLASENLTKLIDEVRELYDVVLIDSSSLSPTADAVAMAPRADGVLLVVRRGRTTVEDARSAREALATVGARLLGSVMTMMPAAATGGRVGDRSNRGPEAEVRLASVDGDAPHEARVAPPTRTPEPVAPGVTGHPASSTASSGSRPRPSPTPRSGIPEVRPSGDLVKGDESRG
jgi:polysaccharide biosynthesis transport protein